MTSSSEVIPAPPVFQLALFTPTPTAAKRVLEFFTAQINNGWPDGNHARCPAPASAFGFDRISPKLNAVSLKPTPMEVQLSPEKEARLRDFASLTGREPAQLVIEAVDRMLEYDARFIEAVEDGRAAARRGKLLEHAEVASRIESMFQS